MSIDKVYSSYSTSICFKLFNKVLNAQSFLLFTVILSIINFSAVNLDAQASKNACTGSYALAFLIDKSGSVREENIVDVEKDALTRVIPELRSDILLSIVGFDNGPFLMLRNRSLDSEGRKLALKRVDALIPVGQTNLLPAVDLVSRVLKESTASCRALVVMSDAKFVMVHDENIFSQIFADRKVDKMSVIAFGKNGDLQSMKNLAKAGNGDLYQITDLKQTEQQILDILSKWRLLE